MHPPPPPPPAPLDAELRPAAPPTQRLRRLNGSRSLLESRDGEVDLEAEAEALEAASSTDRVAATLRDALRRVHCQLDDLGGGAASRKIAQATTPHGTRMALAAFTEKDLGLEDDDDDEPRGNNRGA